VASIEACPFECRAFPAHAAARSLPKVIHRSERRNARKLAHNFGPNAQVDGATRSGTAILLATHDRAAVEVADRVLSMEDGRLAESAPASAYP